MFKRGLIGGPFSLSRDKILPLAPTLSHLNSHGYLGMTAAMTQVSVPLTKIPAYSSFKDYGELRCNLEHKGQRIDQFDLLIGATAIHHGMTLVTSNLKHFERIEGLNIENWK